MAAVGSFKVGQKVKFTDPYIGITREGTITRVLPKSRYANGGTLYLVETPGSVVALPGDSLTLVRSGGKKSKKKRLNKKKTRKHYQTM